MTPKPLSDRQQSRRHFLNNGLKASLAMPFLATGIQSLAQPSLALERAPHPLKILILGGTSYLGPHQIAYALGRGHSISIFTRGKTQPTIHKKLFKEVEHLVGDRQDNLEALKGRQWDAVIDNSGRRVQWAKDTAELLRDQVGHYLYTSSTGVFYPYLKKGLQEEDSLVLEVPADASEDTKLEYDFGVMKANSEMAVRKVFGEDRSIIVRPTYMLGPADRTDRFAHWPVRLAKGGEILVPGKVDDPIQYIDVRDVASWMIRLIENRTAGTFNAVGPASPMGMHAFVYGAHAAFGSAVDWVMVDDYEFLKAQQLYYLIPWIIPIGATLGTACISNQRAIANGLSFTPLAQTVQDTYDWWHSDAVTEERREGLLTSDRSIIPKEQAIIAAWRKR